MTIEQKLRDEYRLGYLDGFAEGYAESFAEGYAESFAEGYAESFAEGYEKSVKEAIIAIKDFLEPAVIAECYQLPLKKVMDILNQE